MARLLARLEAAFRCPLSPDEAREYFEVLRGISPARLEAAFERVRSEFTGRMPYPSEVRARVPEAAPQTPPNPYRTRHRPAPHECRVQPGENRFRNAARALLYQLTPYEAVHVECDGRPRPVCPSCGIEQPPWISSAMALIMEQYPDETMNWNPYHKGLLLCEACQRALMGEVTHDDCLPGL